MKRKIVLGVVAALCSTVAQAVIPQPKSLEKRDGVFVVNQSTTLTYYDSSLIPLAAYMLDYIDLKNFAIDCPDSNYIRIVTDDTLGKEVYRLTINDSGVVITGGDYGGVFNGIQTLLQLFPPDVYTKQCRLPVKLQCIEIEDAPQFPYRGFMLDVARTWSDKDRVKRYIDLIAYHKINKLHIHLVDDEGWRIEIKSHPELTEKGAWRGGSSPIKSVYGKWGELYGGYFTQQTMKEIIEYAAVRNIEVIPEIDLPGHSRTMANIHPEILCDYTPDPKLTNGYEYRSAWCATKEENYAFLEDILSEICELFPSEYVHIGGDEVEMSQWKRCPHCSDYAAKHCNNDFSRLQEIFMSRVSDIIVRHGKKPAVWNEAINGGTLSKQSLVYGWESVKACQKSVGEGFGTVVMPGQYFYLDMRQSKNEDGHNWAAIFDVEQCYSFDFAKQGFTAEQMKLVNGVEGAFWAELYVAHNPETSEYLDYMLFPRLCAVSEIAWGKHGSNWDNFHERLLSEHYDKMGSMGIRFRLSPPVVNYADGSLTATTDKRAVIYWAKENSDKWQRYTSPIKTDKPAEYVFRSEYRTGISPETGVAKHYSRIYPAFKIKSSMPASPTRGFSYAEGYKGISRTARTSLSGDTIEFEFAAPLICREIEFLTGYEHVQRHIFHSGYLEISVDGKSFERIADMHGGRVKLVNPKPFKVARLVCTTDGNGTPFVVIPSPIIKPLL